ncbi:Hsp70 family protein [Nocardioides sp. zg-536]|uniref:Hsp70 family protein n=1 Tax=Nocardioides faecalis TaxID=2803858 RepID=A0A938Y2I8_9ACTN|nr:Hsp70 family protein [Nocardioides faecalis]MBM9458778.1 Hsp70 family protein [Nocardioides faecalis]QVI60196.1 Hsp70 family protein [Nocardioides faecalis]
MIVGFDFGTTNSLVSVVVGDRVIDVMDVETGRPHPSIVRYEGEQVVVGREAKDALGAAGIGVHGNTVKSPKFLLGEEAVAVGGVDRSPVDIVADVVRHVRSESLRSPQRNVLGPLDNAVVTIPVTMDGQRRAALREAFAGAGMRVAQFVHEPLAALYGFIRGAKDPEEMARRLARRNVLVVDWGGGTLDLTLCRVDEEQVRQLRNGGSAQVGGDEFDKVIRDEVVKRVRARGGVADDDLAIPEAELRLFQDAERNKIELSADRVDVTFYRPSYFQSGATLQYQLTRQELEEITRPLVTAGIDEIESLLDSLSMAPGQVSLVVVVGGMAAMPAIRSRLHELFGPDRVEVPPNSATLISQGAAWIAHDRQRLRLAKPIELELARGSLMPLLAAGTEMPLGGEVKHETLHLYCADPTDGKAKFPIATPTALSAHPQASERRTSLGMITLSVDESAPPLHERLELGVVLDDDLVLTVEASSSQKHDRVEASYYDLEFGLGLPEAAIAGGVAGDPKGGEESVVLPKTGLVVRANVVRDKDQTAVPGDVLYAHNSGAFARHVRDGATETQLLEHLYYQPCAVCKRQWGHPECSCGTA